MEEVKAKKANIIVDIIDYYGASLVVSRWKDVEDVVTTVLVIDLENDIQGLYGLPFLAENNILQNNQNLCYSLYEETIKFLKGERVGAVNEDDAILNDCINYIHSSESFRLSVIENIIDIMEASLNGDKSLKRDIDALTKYKSVLEKMA